MTHAEQWGIIAEITKSLYIHWEKVESHTIKQDYLHTGNREVDELAQKRIGRKMVCEPKILFPSEWEDKTEGTIIILEQEAFCRSDHHSSSHQSHKNG